MSISIYKHGYVKILSSKLNSLVMIRFPTKTYPMLPFLISIKHWRSLGLRDVSQAQSERCHWWLLCVWRWGESSKWTSLFCDIMIKMIKEWHINGYQVMWHVLFSASLAGWNPSFFAFVDPDEIQLVWLSDWPKCAEPHAKIVGQNSGTRKHRYLRPFLELPIW